MSGLQLPGALYSTKGIKIYCSTSSYPHGPGGKPPKQKRKTETRERIQKRKIKGVLKFNLGTMVCVVPVAQMLQDPTQNISLPKLKPLLIVYIRDHICFQTCSLTPINLYLSFNMYNISVRNNINWTVLTSFYSGTVGVPGGCQGKQREKHKPEMEYKKETRIKVKLCNLSSQILGAYIQFHTSDRSGDYDFEIRICSSCA